jgi:peroxiredoxin
METSRNSLREKVVRESHIPEEKGHPMRKNILRFTTVLALSLAVYPLCGCASESVGAAPAIGSVVPDFEMKDTAGLTHTLKQYAGKVVVLEMCSIECPWSRGADPHIVELAAKYAPDGVVVLGIDSHKSTTTDQIKDYAGKTGLTFPVLKDVDNQYADVLGAKTTPEVYVVGKDGKLVYHGAFDDREQPEQKGKTSFVDNAVAAALAGKAADPAEAKSWGCSIKRK